MAEPKIAAVIMAAGKGTRLKTALPKVLHEVCGRPMVAYVFDACRSAGVTGLLGVVGYKQELVKGAFADATDITWVEQNPQQGTGHAVMVCREHFATQYDHLLVLCGDGPLVRGDTLQQVIAKHLAEENAITMATSLLEDPSGYGRIDRDTEGRLRGIVEQGDCTPEQLAIREVNPSVYCFRVPELLRDLDRIEPNPKKNEYYITDCLALALRAGDRVEAITAVPPEDILSINTRKDLAVVNRVMRDRILGNLMDEGVTVVDPASTWIDDRATVGPDTIIEPFTKLSGPVRVGANCRVGPLVHLRGALQVADGEHVTASREAAE